MSFVARAFALTLALVFTTGAALPLAAAGSDYVVTKTAELGSKKPRTTKAKWIELMEHRDWRRLPDGSLQIADDSSYTLKLSAKRRRGATAKCIVVAGLYEWTGRRWAWMDDQAEVRNGSAKRKRSDGLTLYEVYSERPYFFEFRTNGNCRAISAVIKSVSIFPALD